jgi:hypothetical protein
VPVGSRAGVEVIIFTTGGGKVTIGDTGAEEQAITQKDKANTRFIL